MAARLEVRRLAANAITTDATQILLIESLPFPLAEKFAAWFECKTLAFEPATGFVAAYNTFSCGSVINNVVTILDGPTVSYSYKKDLAADIQQLAAGGKLQIKVRGIAGRTIEWSCLSEIQFLVQA